MSDYKPEVGEECEVKIKNEWEVITPKFVGKSACVFDYEDEELCFSYKVADYFRPLRTQEVLEREEAIEQVKACFDKKVCLPSDEFFEQLYDAGYRLVGEKAAPEVLTSSFCNNMHQGKLHLAEHLLEKYDIFRKVVK